MSYWIKLRHNTFIPVYVSINSVKSYRNYNVVNFDDFSRPYGEFPVLFKAILNFKDFKESALYSCTFQAYAS